MQRRFKKPIRNIFIIKIIAAFILLIPSTSSQIIESAPGQSVKGTIALGDNTGDEGLELMTEVNMQGLSPSEPPMRQQSLMTINIPEQEYWEVKVKSDEATDGFMTEFDNINSNYIDNGRKLKTPMFVWIDEDNKADLSQGENLLKSGTGPAAFPVFFEQAAIWGDAALPSGREYHMIITFSLN